MPPFYTIIFPVNSISDALIRAGKDYSKANGKGSKKKSSAPPCAHKWCALVVSLSKAISSALEKAKASEEQKIALQNTVDALENHRKSVKAVTDVDAVKLHVESRLKYGDEEMILILHGGRSYQALVDAIVEAF